MAVKKTFSTETEYTRSYNNLSGVDLGGAGSAAATKRLSYAENMYRDYEGEGAGVIESVPGFRRLSSFGAPIRAIFSHKTYGGKEFLLVHAGDTLYRFTAGEGDPVAIATLEDTRSRGYALGGCFYVIDGEQMLKIDGDGNCAAVGSDSAMPYVPTLYHNGAPLEQRNLLTDAFREEYTLTDVSEYAYGSPELKYHISDAAGGLCTVVGIDESAAGEIYVPGKVKIGDRVYTVSKIGDYALAYNNKITKIVIGEGVLSLGICALAYCKYVTDVITPDSITYIGNGAFSDCARLVNLHLGAGLRAFGVSVFASCVSLESVTYGADKDSYDAIENVYLLTNREVTYGVIHTAQKLELPLSSDVLSVERVTVGGEEYPYETLYSNGRVRAVTLKIEGSWIISGKDTVIHGTLRPSESNYGASEETPSLPGKDAIFGCRVAELFDGRIFLSGNPKLPNTVFYSNRDINGANSPLYFGEMNYFNDGMGSYPVISLLSVRDSLAVFKAGDDGTGSIFYHTAQPTDDDLLPKIYPVSTVHSGLCARGDSISFLDDPVFLSPLGLSALEKQEINLERSVATRSHNVNLDLLKENLENATLAEWLGYLAVCVRGRIYLADSRATFLHETGSREYEWFILKGIGTYENAARVYRYASSSSDENYKMHRAPDSVCNSTVWSEAGASEELVYYSEEDGVKYALYPTDEMRGGDFSPAVAFFGDGYHLYFGTESGVVCTFNNDMRGTPPESLKSMSDFDEDEYERIMGHRIHPEFYSFDRHAPRYAVKSVFDDCGLPHLTKNTVKHSLVLKCKAYSGTSLHCEVGTDRRSYSEVAYFPAGEFSFAELDFSRLTFCFGEYFSVPLTEKEKGWVEKQITVFSEEPNSPIGIYSATYRYTVRGKLKRT